MPNQERKSQKSAGFTIVEIVVMMTIITAISAIVLVSFTGLHEGAAANRSARDLSLAVRRAQNMSLAVTRIETGAGPRTPSAVGIRLEQDAGTYFLFADLVRDNKYASEDARIPGNEIFEGGVHVRSLTYRDVIGQRQTAPIVHIIFSAPEAAMMLSDEDGNSINEILEIELVTPSGQLAKNITIRTSGQVSVK